MTDRSRVARLTEMAAMVFDAKAEAMRAANHKREDIQRQIQALEAEHDPDPGLWPANKMAAFSYQQWAAERRSKLNVQLAAQSVVCLQAAEAAKLAFGRNQILQRLARPKR